MKYEKFEEWMIGKKFYHTLDPVGIGVIVGEGTCEGVVSVIYEKDGPSWAWLCNVNFVDSPEEKPSDDQATAEEDRQIDWQVGQVVWDVLLGKGVVFEISTTSRNPVGIKFNSGSTTHAYRDGSLLGHGHVRTLFFSEPVIKAELYPPKKPFTPVLKKGDVVIVGSKVSSGVVKVTVDYENSDHIKTDKQTIFKKEYWNFYKLGEEVKFQ